MSLKTLIAVLALTAGCKDKAKDAPSGDPKKTGDGKTGDKPADKPAAKPCPADHTKSEAHGFCIKLPAGFKVKQENKMGSTQTNIEYGNADNSDSVSITVNKFDQMRWDMELKMSKDTSDAAKGTGVDLPDGVGKNWVYEQDGNDVYSKSVTKNATNYIICQTRTGKNDTTLKTRIEYCKSLMAL